MSLPESAKGGDYDGYEERRLLRLLRRKEMLQGRQGRKEVLTESNRTFDFWRGPGHTGQINKMKLKCEECGRVFENERRRKYCSTACRMKRYYRKCGTQIDKLNADIARQNVRRSEARRAMKARLAERDAAYAAAFPGNPGVRRVGAIRFSDQQAAMAGILSRFR